MQSPASSSQERPYRSHLRPACYPCRRRKSRCKLEAHSSSCLMCRVHGTACTFPGASEPEVDRSAQSRLKSPARNRAVSSRSTLTAASSLVLSESSTGFADNVNSASADTSCSVASGLSRPTVLEQRNPLPSAASTGSSWPELRDSEQNYHQPTPLSVDDAEQENPHIVGPANTNDSQVLADYLSTISHSNGGVRMVRPVPASRSKPVLFATVKKRPLGMDTSSNPSREKLYIIEKLLEPKLDQLIDLYFKKINVCLPLLDYNSFKLQYNSAKERISSALLASLYAHTLVYWRFLPELYDRQPPDVRFIWNLANEALYSELHLSPGISTVTAILLNIGGRPTTSLVGNGVQLGAAVSLAHSLGLNRDPLPWDIPDAEKHLRMKIWWSLLIHDKWSSLAYGTPSHIQKAQYDVPLPNISFFDSEGMIADDCRAGNVFIALYSLTEVLDYYLQHLYRVDRNQPNPIQILEFKMNQWVESLRGDVRLIITRGTRLDLPGAANLRLSYLSVQLLLRRLELEGDREMDDTEPELLANRYIQVRSTAEQIVLLVQELEQEHLGDFWLPVSAFVFPSTTTFLLRCALETENSQIDLAHSTSLRLAWDLITALRHHRDQSGWDLGDICLAQHAEIVEKLMKPATTQAAASYSSMELQGIEISDASFMDQLFPSLWDTFRNC